MKLRPYQIEAMQGVDDKLSHHKSTLIEMATGLGKTVVFSHIADRWPGRVLVIAHRDELIRQAAEKIYQITGHKVSVEMGRESATDELYSTKVTVGSVQTLCRERRRNKFHPDHFSLLVVDEGHHGTASTYREVSNYFDSAKKLYVTATPNRGDGIGLHNVCESVAYQYGIEPAIDDGWLVPVKQVVVKVDGLDFSKARTIAKDFNAADLDRILTEEEPLHAMCASGHDIIGNRQALWFCNSVNHAKLTAGVLARYSQDNVVFLSGESAIADRREAVKRFKKGHVQHLVNCGLFLEGFDAPNTAVVVMARPTKSLALYMQVMGRGTRPLEGILDREEITTAEGRRNAIAMSDKPDMTVIDFAGNAGRHKIIQAADVLGGKHADAVKEYAKQTMEEEGRSADIKEALDRAKMELELWDEQSEKRKHIKAQPVYQTQEVSPFVKSYNPKKMKRSTQPQEPCSKKQAGLICFLSSQIGKPWKFSDAMALTKIQASAVINRLKREAG